MVRSWMVPVAELLWGNEYVALVDVLAVSAFPASAFAVVGSAVSLAALRSDCKDFLFAQPDPQFLHLVAYVGAVAVALSFLLYSFAYTFLLLLILDRGTRLPVFAICIPSRSGKVRGT